MSHEVSEEFPIVDAFRRLRESLYNEKILVTGMKAGLCQVINLSISGLTVGSNNFSGVCQLPGQPMRKISI